MKKALIFFFGETLSKGINWIILGILFFLAKDNVASYGVLGILVAIERILITFLLLGQNRFIFRYYDHSKSKLKFLSSVASGWVISTILFCAIFYGIVAAISKDYFFSVPVFPDLLVLMLTLLLNNVINFQNFYQRITFDDISYSKRVLLLSVYKMTVIIILSFYLDIVLAYVLGVFIGQLVSIVTSLSIFKVIKLHPRLDKKILKSSLAYGWPLILQGLLSTTLVYVDRFFLEAYVSLKEIGLYTFAMTIGSGLVFITSGLASYFEPLFFKNRESEKLASYINIYISLSIFIMSLIVIFINSVYCLWSELFEVDILLLNVICFSFLLNPFYYTVSCVYMIFDSNKYVLIMGVLASIISVAFNSILIVKYGVIGAVSTLFIVYIFLSLVNYQIMKKYINFQFSEIITFALTVSSVIVTFYIYSHELLVFIVSVLLILLANGIYIKMNFRHLRRIFEK